MYKSYKIDSTIPSHQSISDTKTAHLIPLFLKDRYDEPHRFFFLLSGVHRLPS